MKNNEYVEQLLTGLIDGELTEREKTELKRLMRNNRDIEKHLVSLRGCKTLLGSLPVEKAPADTLKRTQIAAGLIEPETIKPQFKQPETQEPDIVKQASKEFLRRKVLSAAAVILLAAGLIAVVWTILSPHKPVDNENIVAGNDRTALEGNYTPKPADITAKQGNDTAAVDVTLAVNPETPMTAKQTITNTEITPGFSGILRVKSSQVLAADVSVKKILEQIAPDSFTALPTQAGRYVYSVSCDTAKLNAVLGGLEGIWNQFSEASLSIESGAGENPVTIEAVRSWQIGEIAAVNDSEKRLKAAQYYAITNSAKHIMENQVQTPDLGDELFNLLEKPKPVLTKDEQANLETTADRQVHLVIEIHPDE